MLLLAVIVGIALCVSTATAIWALVRVSATVHEIQTERERNIRDGCADQNSRHNETIRRLLRIGRDRDAIRRTTLLIDALAPYRNCDQLAKRQVRAAR